jgi:hypothetical protein
MPREADAYVELAVEVIPFAKSAIDLRDWWAAEGDRRYKYGLSQQQIDVLIEACKEHIDSLGEVVNRQPPPQTKPQPRAHLRRTAFI